MAGPDAYGVQSPEQHTLWTPYTPPRSQRPPARGKGTPALSAE